MRLLNLQVPHLVVMVGIPGAGKSFFASHFAKTFGIPLINGTKIRQDLFASPKFNDEEDEIVNRIADTLLNELLKTGQTIIYDIDASSKSFRNELAKKVDKLGYKILLVWVQTESEAAKKRSLKTRPGSRSFESFLANFKPPTETEKPLVISGKHTYASQLKIVLRRLTEPRAAAANSHHKQIR